MKSFKNFVNMCIASIWIICTAFVVIVGVVCPLQLILAEGEQYRPTEMLTAMLFSYVYIMYVLYTIDYAAAKWDPIKDSIYVPSCKFNKVQEISMLVIAIVFIICLIYVIMKYYGC